MRVLSMKNNTQQQGFTLIELVIVIVILGILAATAAPKFIDLQGDAKNATLKGVRGSIETAMAGTYAKAIIAGVEKDAAKSVTINGATVSTEYGYPKAVAATILKVAELDDYDVKDVAGSKIVMIYPKGTAPTSPAITDTCSVVYTEATSATAKATSKVNTGC